MLGRARQCMTLHGDAQIVHRCGDLIRQAWQCSGQPVKADLKPVQIVTVIVFPQVAGTGDKKGIVWIEVEVRRVFNLIL